MGGQVAERKAGNIEAVKADSKRHRQQAPATRILAEAPFYLP